MHWFRRVAIAVCVMGVYHSLNTWCRGFREIDLPNASAAAQPEASKPTGEPRLADTKSPEGLWAARADAGADAARAGQHVPRLRYEMRLVGGRVKAGGSIPVEARLINEGDAPVVVYWGDYAYEDIYRFAIRRDGQPIPAPRERFTPPGGGDLRQFREIEPGETLAYKMFLGGSGANCQRYFFRYPGVYTIEPSLAISTTTYLDPQTGREISLPGAWSGELKVAPLSVTVDENPATMSNLTVRGQVVDADTGKPLPDVKVLLTSRRASTSPSWSPFVEVETGYAFTGADGRFSFGRLPEDAPQFALKATHADYISASAIVNVAPPTKDYQADITMQPGVRVRGRIEDSAGLPVAGARVNHADKTAYTDREGRFILSGTTASLHEGNPAIWVDVWKKGFVSGRGWPAPQEAQGGQWTLRLWREKELACSGQVVFAEGGAASGVALEFRLEDAKGRLAYARGEADLQGGFSVVLPQAGEFSGTVQATGFRLSGYNEPRERWLTPVARLGPGMKNVRIVLEDRGVIRATVKTTNTLPQSLKFRVQCDIADIEGGYSTVCSSELDSSGGTATMGRLSPGKYRVTVTAVPQVHWHWTKEVVLDANAPDRAEDLEFIVPEKKVGSVQATVLAPDGKTLVSKGRVWLDSTAMARGFPIVDGEVHLEDIAVGRIWLTTTVEGMARQTIKSIVRDGQTTDLGRIVLQKLEDATGVVAGRILYDDGTPALGAALVNETFHRTPVLADGNYTVRLLAGEGTVVIDLTEAVGWPRAAADIGRLGAPWGTDTIMAPVQVPAGGKVELDIVLPRKKIIDLEIDFRGTEKAGLGLTLAVELDRCRLVRTWSTPQGGPGVIRIPYLPSGPTTVALHAAGLGFRSCQVVPEGRRKNALVFAPSVTGTLVVRAVDRDGNTVKGVPLTIRNELTEWLDEPVRGLRSDYVPISGFGVASGKAARLQRELDDGTVEFAGLGPGVYFVHVAEGAADQSLRAQVQAGKSTPVHVVVDRDELVEEPSATRPATRPGDLRLDRRGAQSR